MQAMTTTMSIIKNSIRGNGTGKTSHQNEIFDTALIIEKLYTIITSNPKELECINPQNKLFLDISSVLSSQHLVLIEGSINLYNISEAKTVNVIPIN